MNDNFKVEISPDFTTCDIHKIREADYERTKNMTFEEIAEYYREGAKAATAAIEALRKKRKTA